MSALTDILSARIAAEGPLNIADYMADCLLHPAHGYYATRDPFGAAGDFITAPEISQMFGELLGLCLAQAWMDQGMPDRIALAEIGPGRGTLMADMLRAIKKLQPMRDAVEIHLVEASDLLRGRQAETLAGEVVIWHDLAADLPELPLFLVANEFFDALPIRQFQRGQTHWHERHIGLDDSGQLTPGIGPETNYPSLTPRLADTKPGDIVEICPALPAITEEIAGRIARHGGAALIIDYGGWHSLGDTLQALRAHEFADPFTSPGSADLTAHVDFEAIAFAAKTAGAAVTALTPQGEFLDRLGIAERAHTLSLGLEGAALASHSAAHYRLTHPQEMGTLFKVLGLFPKGAPPPPGLEKAANR